MKNIVVIILTIISFSLIAQDLEYHADLVNISNEIKIIDSNLEEIENTDISHLWMNHTEDKYGFMGNYFHRMEMDFQYIKKMSPTSNNYFVNGTSKIQAEKNFTGIIQVHESFYIQTPEFQEGNIGVMVGEYVFYDDVDEEEGGIFQGRFATYFYKDENGEIRYNNLWNISPEFNNNQFAGYWKSYGEDKEIIANWGDNRIPHSEDLDIGKTSFQPSGKYIPNGWEEYDFKTISLNAAKE